MLDHYDARTSGLSILFWLRSRLDIFRTLHIASNQPSSEPQVALDSALPDELEYPLVSDTPFAGEFGGGDVVGVFHSVPGISVASKIRFPTGPSNGLIKLPLSG